MKKNLLLGLAALALGGMTSCSNILEESGVPVATANTGSLVLSLGQDGDVNIVTKALEEAGDSYIVKLSGTESKEWTYSAIKGKKVSLKAGTYTLVAYNKADTEVKNFEWNAPYYKGTSPNITVEANKEVVETVTCFRANSTIAVDTTGLGTGDGKVVYVKSLVAKTTGEETTFDLLKKDGVAATANDSICVKAGIPVTVVLTAVRISDGKELAAIETPLVAETGNTAAKTKYTMTYSLGTGAGGGQFTIKVDNGVETVEVPTTVNPYGE